MSYRVQGPNLDKILSATETRHILCADKMMSGNVVISRYTSEPENMAISGPNLYKENQTGTILCNDKMMSGNISFSHTAKAQLYVDIDTTQHFSVTYNGVTYPQGHGLYEVERGKTLTVTYAEAFRTGSGTTYYNYVYENGEKKVQQFGAGTYTIIVPSTANAITVTTGTWTSPGHERFSINIIYSSEGMMQISSQSPMYPRGCGISLLDGDEIFIDGNSHPERPAIYYTPKMNGYIIWEYLSSSWEYSSYANDRLYFNDNYITGGSSGSSRYSSYNLPGSYSTLRRIWEKPSTYATETYYFWYGS